MIIEEEQLEKIEQNIFSEDANTFVVLDGASNHGLLEKLYLLEPEFVCLFRGDLEPDMALVAPYLVRLERGNEFSNWVLSKGWGKHWGIFAVSYSDLRETRNHLRSLLTVYDENGKPLSFRYYDPRVLRLYLPTCNTDELKTFFGPVNCFFLEDEDPERMLRYELTTGGLRRKRIAIESSM
jgi:Domain of unknown function (DUF4123)